jgi:DNA-binding transcriptional MerR regulator
MTFKQAELLSIGEFAAATQLSLKALRLYDEQQVLRPARVDSATGYRYYRRDQVPVARLIRTLRAMDMPVARLGAIVASDRTASARAIHDWSLELERRFAREKRAFHAALLQLSESESSRGDSLAVRTAIREQRQVIVRPFHADKHSLVARFRAEVEPVAALAGACCALVEPLSDDEARFEAWIPANSEAPSTRGSRWLPKAPCVECDVDGAHASGVDITGALDGLFDWLDRAGFRAIEPPAVEFSTTMLPSKISWAYTQG